MSGYSEIDGRGTKLRGVNSQHWLIEVRSISMTQQNTRANYKRDGLKLNMMISLRNWYTIWVSMLSKSGL